MCFCCTSFQATIELESPILKKNLRCIHANSSYLRSHTLSFLFIAGFSKRENFKKESDKVFIFLFNYGSFKHLLLKITNILFFSLLLKQQIVFNLPFTWTFCSIYCLLFFKFTIYYHWLFCLAGGYCFVASLISRSPGPLLPLSIIHS